MAWASAYPDAGRPAICLSPHRDIPARPAGDLMSIVNDVVVRRVLGDKLDEVSNQLSHHGADNVNDVIS